MVVALPRAPAHRLRPRCPHLAYAVLAVALWGAAASPAAEVQSDLAARLDEATRRTEAARNGGRALGDPGTLFPETEEVAAATGAMRVDHAALRAEWAAVPGEGDGRRAALDRLRDRLAAVRAEMEPGRRDGAAGPPPDRWREKLADVLSRPEFTKRPLEASLMERALNWLRDKLGSLFPERAQKALGSIGRWVVYALAGVAIMLVLIVLVRAALPLLRREALRPGGGPAPGHARPETPETLLALADARARAGDSRGAVQALFRWLLLCLHQGGRLDYDPALTNREHLARLKMDGALRAAFEDLSGRFELAWYALRPVGPDEVAAFRERARALAGEVGA